MYAAVVQVQWRAGMYRSRVAYREAVFRYLEQVRSAVPAGEDVLVAFPEDLGTFLIFCGAPAFVMASRRIDLAVGRLVAWNLPRVLVMKLRYRESWVRSLALAKSTSVRTIHEGVFSEAAKAYGYWLVAGTICASRGRGGSVFNECQLYAPNGEKHLAQRKVYLTDLEARGGLDLTPAPIEDLRVADVAGKRVAIAICLDAFRDDVLERLCPAGVDVLVQPSANPGKWSVEQQSDWLTGCWGAVVERERAHWGLNPMLVGDALGLSFEGQSSIVASEPAKAPARGGYLQRNGLRGFAKVASSAVEEQVLVMDIG